MQVAHHHERQLLGIERLRVEGDDPRRGRPSRTAVVAARGGVAGERGRPGARRPARRSARPGSPRPAGPAWGRPGNPGAPRSGRRSRRPLRPAAAPGAARVDRIPARRSVTPPPPRGAARGRRVPARPAPGAAGPRRRRPAARRWPRSPGPGPPPPPARGPTAPSPRTAAPSSTTAPRPDHRAGDARPRMDTGRRDGRAGRAGLSGTRGEHRVVRGEVQRRTAEIVPRALASARRSPAPPPRPVAAYRSRTLSEGPAGSRSSRAGSSTCTPVNRDRVPRAGRGSPASERTRPSGPVTTGP